MTTKKFGTIRVEPEVVGRFVKLREMETYRTTNTMILTNLIDIWKELREFSNRHQSMRHKSMASIVRGLISQWEWNETNRLALEAQINAAAVNKAAQ